MRKSMFAPSDRVIIVHRHEGARIVRTFEADPLVLTEYIRLCAKCIDRFFKGSNKNA